jgi:hypothetical protein
MVYFIGHFREMTERNARRLRVPAIDGPIQQTSERLDYLLASNMYSPRQVARGLAAPYSSAGDRGWVAFGPRLEVCLSVTRTSRSAKVTF